MAHFILPLAVVVLVAIAGVAYMVLTHAQTTTVEATIGAPAGDCIQASTSGQATVAKCNGATNQRWELTAQTINNKSLGSTTYCLTATSTASRAAVVSEPCNTAVAGQAWVRPTFAAGAGTMEDVYAFQHGGTKMCLVNPTTVASPQALPLVITGCDTTATNYADQNFEPGTYPPATSKPTPPKPPAPAPTGNVAILNAAKTYAGAPYAAAGPHSQGSYTAFANGCGKTASAIRATIGKASTKSKCAVDCSGLVSAAVDLAYGQNFGWTVGGGRMNGGGSGNWKAVGIGNAQQGDIVTTSSEHVEIFVSRDSKTGLVHTYGAHHSGTVVSPDQAGAGYYVQAWRWEGPK
jgi:hypothetical protein